MGNYKNLISTILGIILMMAGIFFFFYLPSFGVIKLIVAEVLGTILMRCWINKEKGLGWIEKLIK